MKKIVYLDTSALAKWYLNEPRSDAVEKYIQEHGPVAISDLTVVEMRSLLARRRREKHIDATTETRVFASLQEDMRQRFLVCYPLPNELAAAAINLISSLPHVPLRTLDALHLAIAKEIDAATVVTADRVMVVGAEAMGFSVVRFDR
jgi:predicted nucleic acid-binding protein